MAQLIYEERFKGEGVKVIDWPDEMPNEEAKFAMELVRTNGILMGSPAGEDSSGRAKVEAMPPEELAKRACDVSQALFAEMRKRNLMRELPDYEVARDLAREERDRN